MRKEIPWTLEGKSKRKYTKNKIKDGKKVSPNKKNAISLVERLFKENKNKAFTCYEISDLIGKGKATVGIALEYLKEQGIIVITNFRKSNVLVPFYQYKTAKIKGIEVLDYKTEGLKAGLITARAFRAENNITNSTKFGYLISESNIPSVVVQTRSTFCYAYKNKDLKKLLKKYSEEGTLMNKTTEPTVFKIFGFTITISK